MAEKHPQDPAEDVPYLVPQNWAELMENQRVLRSMGSNEFARYLDHPKITSPRMTRWRSGEDAASPDLAIHVAVKLGIPATLALELAGHHEVAEYIAKVAGRTGPRAAALEPLVAQVKAITSGLPPDRAEALQQDLLDKASDWFVAAEVEASQLRKHDDDGTDGQAADAM
jgi:hypothetical protein